MKKALFWFFPIFILGIFSCDKEDHFPNDENYIHINVNGEEYTIRNSESTTLDIINCEEKEAFLVSPGAIENAEIYFELFLNQYKKLSNLEADNNTKHFVNNKKASVSCNYDVEVDFRDIANNDNDPYLPLGGRNYINEVVKLGETSTLVNYGISGEFKCTFFNKQGTEILIFGEYNVLTSVEK